MSKTTRVQVELPASAFDRLNRLKDRTEATSYSEVIKNALKVYATLVDQQEAGSVLCVKNNDDSTTMCKVVF